MQYCALHPPSHARMHELHAGRSQYVQDGSSMGAAICRVFALLFVHGAVDVLLLAFAFAFALALLLLLV